MIFSFHGKPLFPLIACLTKKVISRGAADGVTPSPPKSFKIIINRETANMMDIDIPDKLLMQAVRVYP